MSVGLRSLLCLVAFVLTALVVVPVALVGVMFLSGPHGGALPDWTHPFVLGLGWACVIALPLWMARKVWILGARRRPQRAR